MNKTIRSFACYSDEKMEELRKERQHVRNNPIYVDVDRMTEDEIKLAVTIAIAESREQS